MKRFGDLFDDVSSRDNLWSAWLDFRRGKRQRPSVLRFERFADRHVMRLHRALIAGSYRASGYKVRVIREPKVRLIAAAPVRDRVVHHAIHRVLAPRLDPGLIRHTYACLPGRGSHRAVLAFQAALRRHAYVLQLDIRHYFLSINHQVLLSIMARKLRPGPLMSLLERIVDSGRGLYAAPHVARALGLPLGFPPPGCGLPIGNLTSQWWGNHYLSGLDHHLGRVLRVPHVQRYMDDITLMGDDRDALVAARENAAVWLANERQLVLKHPRMQPRSAHETFAYLGYRVSRGGIEPLARTHRRLRERLAGHAIGGRHEAAERTLAAYKGVYMPWHR